LRASDKHRVPHVEHRHVAVLVMMTTLLHNIAPRTQCQGVHAHHLLVRRHDARNCLLQEQVRRRCDAARPALPFAGHGETVRHSSSCAVQQMRRALNVEHLLEVLFPVPT